MDKSLKLTIEEAKRLSNIKHELLQTFYDRRTVVERYLDGSVAIHIHLLTSKDCLCITCIKADASKMSDSCKSFVFVGVGKVSKEFRPVASVIRL